MSHYIFLNCPLFLCFACCIYFLLCTLLIVTIISGLAHRGSWSRLESESCVLRQGGLAKGTWANKISHLRSYITFTSYFNVPDFPVHLGVLLRFLALLGRGSLAYKSVVNMLGSIRWWASLIDPPSAKVFDAVLVQVSLRGLKAQLSRPIHQKLPLSVAHLLKFYNTLDLSDVRHLSGWCAMLIAFFGCFRLSNLVPTSVNNFDPLKHLTRDDVSFEKDIVLIFYKWSKTNQNASKVSWLPLSPVSDARFNVKCYLEKLLSIVNAKSDAPLFSYGKCKFHTRFTLSKLLDVCLFEASLSPADYSWHSFRRGAAVFAFELGLSDSAVQLLGDWSSDAFKDYLEFSFDRKLDVAESISKKFDHYVKNC